MVPISEFLADLTDEVCRADYLSLRQQEKYMLEMAAHKAPIPGEGYLYYMAANEVKVEIALKKQGDGFFRRLIIWLFRKKKSTRYRVTSKQSADISLSVIFRRPLSSPLLGKKSELSKMYDLGQPLEKDWEMNTYVSY